MRLFAELYTNPNNRVTFGNATEAWKQSRTKYEHSMTTGRVSDIKCYWKRKGLKYLQIPLVNNLVQEILNRNMKQQEYNMDSVLDLLKVHIESDNPSEALAAKKELLSNWKEITKLQLQHGFGVIDENLDSLTTEELLSRINDTSSQLLESEKPLLPESTKKEE